MMQLREEWGNFFTYSLVQIVRNAQMTHKVMRGYRQNAFQPDLYMSYIQKKSMIDVILLEENILPLKTQ